MSHADRRVRQHPILPSITDDATISFTFNGLEVRARSSETLAAALLAQGFSGFSRNDRSGKPRGIYCAIGHCFSCLVNVDGRSGVRACLTRVKEGMVVESPKLEDGERS